VEEIGVAERERQRHPQLDLRAVLLDLDSLASEPLQLRRRERPRFDGDLELAVDHAVRPVADDRELVGETGVRPGVIAGIGRQPDAERGEELRVGDVLNLGADDAPRDLEPRLIGKRARQRRDDAVVLAREQRVDRGERDVLVRAHIAGDDGLRGLPHQRPHEIHRRRARDGAACVGARQVAVARQHERRAVAQPVEPRGRDAVDVRPVDVAADRVDLLPRRRDAGARRRGRACEIDRQVALELLERVMGVERNRRVLSALFVAKAEVVIEELPPRPAPLRDAVLREEVLPYVVEDAVADVSRRRPGDHPRDAVGVVRGGNSNVRRSRLPPGDVQAVVLRSVQRTPR
jgi:hypothetical protein